MLRCRFPGVFTQPLARHALGRVSAGRQWRCVTVWPQWPYDEKASNAKAVGEPEFRWPPRKPPKEPAAGQQLSPAELEDTRGKTHLAIWTDMVDSNWSSWERRFWDLRERRIPYDEVTYTLLLHGYLLSHRHSAENAYLVLEEMKRAETHPALVRLNERLLNSAFELRELGVQPEASRWQNVVRLCWHCSIRFQKKRRRRLYDELEALEPDDVLALGADDAVGWLRGHDRLALPPPSSSSGPARFLAGRAALPALTPPSQGRRSKRRGSVSAGRGREPDC